MGACKFQGTSMRSCLASCNAALKNSMPAGKQISSRLCKHPRNCRLALSLILFSCGLMADGGLWGTSHQRRTIIDARKREKVTRSFRFTSSAYLRRDIAMRSVPMAVTAEHLKHADTRMTEGHFAHLALSCRHHPRALP
jgi:hypothetical protein